MKKNNLKVVVASQNPVKLDAVKYGFCSIFPSDSFSFEAVDAPSDISNQPMNDAETLLGAENRAKNVGEIRPEADFWVGVEGGVDTFPGEPDKLGAFAWVVIQSRFASGRARTGIFELPKMVADLVRSGTELGTADDIVFGKRDSKKQNGAVGILTDDVLTRTTFYIQAVQLALIPIKNFELYENGNAAKKENVNDAHA